LLALSDSEKILLGSALLENLERVHQLIVVGDAASLGGRITKRQPRDSVA
jgi:hypothetical protein